MVLASGVRPAPPNLPLHFHFGDPRPGFLVPPWRKGQPPLLPLREEGFILFGKKKLTKTTSVTPENHLGFSRGRRDPLDLQRSSVSDSHPVVVQVVELGNQGSFPGGAADHTGKTHQEPTRGPGGFVASEFWALHPEEWRQAGGPGTVST